MASIYSAFFQKNPNINKKTLSKKDIEYVNSLSAAVLETNSKRLHWVLISFFITISAFIIWAYFAKIDEIARGNGKVVPSGQNQIIQNLEGGIVSEILVEEGQSVVKDQVLLRISNEKGIFTAMSSELKALYLKAQIKRLQAELKREDFVYEKGEDEKFNELLENEKALFDTNKRQLESKILILKDQIKQKQSELQDARQT